MRDFKNLEAGIYEMPDNESGVNFNAGKLNSENNKIIKSNFVNLLKIALLTVWAFLLPFTVSAQFADGDGSEEFPYIIETAEQLAQLATFVNANDGDYNDKFYKLANNIDLSSFQEGEGWEPIGLTPEIYFKGVFDGNNKIITGLFIDNTSLVNVGLFGYIAGATIKNLGVVNANLTHSNAADTSTGIIVGYNSSAANVINCYSTGSVTSASTGGNTNCGGIAGQNFNYVLDCYSMASVNVTDTNNSTYVGGIVGSSMFGRIANCYSTGLVSATSTGTAYVGGIAGYDLMGSISNSAALNPEINLSGGTGSAYGRVLGNAMAMMTTLLRNVAYVDMLNPDGETVWNAIGANQKDGENIDLEAIHADGTFDDRFSDDSGWTTENGKLPGFGTPVKMPRHLCFPGTPFISTENLPDGDVGVEYNQTLIAEGTTPIIWSIESGNLPAGLDLSEQGVIFGVPTEQGTFDFTVKATNTIGNDTEDFSINVILTGNPPEIKTEDLPDGEVGEEYNQTLIAEGTTPIKWLLESGDLPAGLELSEQGVIFGVPTEKGTFDFTVKATNIIGSDTKDLSINVILTGNLPDIKTENLPDGEVGEEYNQTLIAEGTTPITWLLESGDLPAGLELSEQGFIFGVPTEQGTFDFTVKATNIIGSDTKDLTIIIKPGIGIFNNLFTQSLTAFVQDGILYISGLSVGEKWSVYTTSGVLITESRQQTESENVYVKLPCKGIYIVQSGKKVVKVVNK